MTNRTIEATLKIGAKEGNMAALLSVAQRLAKIEAATKAVNRANMATLKSTQAQMLAVRRSMEVNAVPIAQYLAPAAIAYGALESIKAFAKIERQLTRTGLVLGATRADMTGLYADFQKSAKAFALPTQEVVDIAGAYAAAGATLGEIRSDVGTLAKATQAIGASGTDVVATWDAARKSLNLSASDAEKFFEIVAAGTIIGKFEGNDMAQFLPTLLPVAARQGFTGLEGSTQIVAFLETMRDYVGSASEAATSLADLLEKIASPEVEGNFADFGIDLPKTLKEAKEQGKDLFGVLHDIIQQATGGDASQLGKLFGDKEARRAADVLLRQIDRIRKGQSSLSANAPNILNRNNAALLTDAEASLTRIADTLEALKVSGGRLIDSIGVVDFGEAVANQIDAFVSKNDELMSAISAGWTPLAGADAWQSAFSTALDDGKSLAEALQLARTASEGVLKNFAAMDAKGSVDQFDKLRKIMAEIRAERESLDGEVKTHLPGWENVDPAMLPDNGPILPDLPAVPLLPRRPFVVKHGLEMPVDGPIPPTQEAALFDEATAREAGAQAAKPARDSERLARSRAAERHDDRARYPRDEPRAARATVRARSHDLAVPITGDANYDEFRKAAAASPPPEGSFAQDIVAAGASFADAVTSAAGVFGDVANTLIGITPAHGDEGAGVTPGAAPDGDRALPSGKQDRVRPAMREPVPERFGRPAWPDDMPLAPPDPKRFGSVSLPPIPTDMTPPRDIRAEAKAANGGGDFSAMLAGMEKAGAEITQGGQAAGDAIKGGADAGAQAIEQAAQAINAAGQEGGSAFARMLEGVGARIGTEAAAAFKANVGSLTVNARVSGPAGGSVAPQGASGNKGQSMPGAGRVPGGV